MSARYGNLPGVTNHYGSPGLGVLGSVVRSDTATGAHGAGYLYNDWSSGDDGKEFRGLIVTPPASGTLFAYENGSFDFTASADGAYSFVYQLYVDGVDLGTAFVGIGINATPPVDGGGGSSVTYTSARRLLLSEVLRGVS